MASRPRPPGRRARRVAVLAVAAAGVLSGCAVDPGVTTVGAGPVSRDRSMGGPADPARPAPTEPAPGTTGDTPTTDPAPPETTAPPPTTSTLPPLDEPLLLVEIPVEDVVNTGGAKPARSYDDFVAVALTDIERWWGEVFPAVYGAEFAPLDGGVYAGYPNRPSDVPGCGEPRTDYPDLNLYVAFYCQFGDFMVYDDGDDSLLAELANEFGPAVMGVVLAHEYGHAIQQRAGLLDRNIATIFTEQQADCLAGAWTGQAYRGESRLLRLGDRDVRTSLIAMLSVRDPVGTDQFVPGGHGSAFDRVGAFQEGFLHGPARCAELIDAPLPLMPNVFVRNTADAALGGNAPYDCDELDFELPDCEDAPVFLADDLNSFWTTVLGAEFPTLTPLPSPGLDQITCVDPVPLATEVVLCPRDGTVAYDETAILELYREFGDFTLGYFYGIAWAESVQRFVGSPLTGEARALLNDCLTGAWVRDITPGVDPIGTEQRSMVSTSAGDLDEAIRVAIIVGDAGAEENVVGSPFEKIGSFRAGVLGGLDACGDVVPA